MPNLVHAVEKLKEYLRAIVAIAVWVVLTAFRKHVAERDPIFFDEDLEAFESAVVWVDHQLSQRAKLGCSIPAIWTMDQNIVLLMGERVQDLICARKNPHKDRPVARAI